MIRMEHYENPEQLKASQPKEIDDCQISNGLKLFFDQNEV